MASPVRETGSDKPTAASKLLEQDWKDWDDMARDLFNTLPPPPIPLLPEDDTYDISKYKNKPKLSPAEASQKCADAIEKYDAEECKAHREEIDTLLVFAGLFSAVVTAFTIESHQWLQDDPNDAIIALLSHLADQPPPTTNDLPDAVSSRINAYWFLSLVLSLSSALVAILCKQWVREFERHTGLSDATQFIGIRQMKLQGFEAWHVAGVVALIPILLQSALGLFAVGVIELLWNLHRMVAIVALVPTLAALLFYAFTTLMPAIQAFASPFRIFRGVPQCPFKSPQALLTLRLLVLLPIIHRRCSRVPWVVLHFLSRNSLVLWEFLCRKCFVFCRRVPASRNPQSWDTYEGVPHSLWRRVVVLWRKCFVFRRPVHASSDIVSPAVISEWYDEMLRLPTSSTRQLDNATHFPAFNHTKSWLQVDQVFTTSRDDALIRDEHNEVLRKSETDTIPPQFYFSGLSWLRDHVQEVSMESWIQMSIWERINLFAHGPHTQSSEALSHLVYGINAACPSADLGVDYGERNLSSLALSYARFMQMGGAFITELIIHNLDGITLNLDDDKILSMHLEADAESSQSFVHRMLYLELNTRFADQHAMSGFAKYMHYCSPWALSYQAMACLGALQLRALLRPIQDLRAWSFDEFSDPYERGAWFDRACRDLCVTLLVVTARLRTDLSDSRTPVPEREMSIFAAWVLTIDRHHEQWTRECDSGGVYVMYASQLAHPDNQAVYLDLLSAALGSRSLAEDHLPILRDLRSPSVLGGPASPEPGQAMESPVPAHTALDLPDSSVKPADGAPSPTPRDAELGAAVSANAESWQAEPTGVDPAAAAAALCDEEPGPTTSPALRSGATSAAAVALAGATTVARCPPAEQAGLGLAAPRGGAIVQLPPIAATDDDSAEQMLSLSRGASAAGGQARDGELQYAGTGSSPRCGEPGDGQEPRIASPAG